MKIYYRISNNSEKKERLSNATKEHCLTIFLREFDREDNQIEIVADNVTEKKLKDFIFSQQKKNLSIEETALGNTQSFKYVLKKACQLDDLDEMIFFAEDDYLYLPNSDQVLKEGLGRADYVSLYDHPDKYQDGLNPFVKDGGEKTKVILTQSSHWKFTNSSTMTFASQVKTLKADYKLWERRLVDTYPYDFKAFRDLRRRGRKLITPIPSLSTHAEPKFLAPLIDWSRV
ncbi:MAG: hypothetical protein UR93_C0005G0033 [Berkelbacteria bacterium GW2011_GWA2_35_9]|uniref:Glycosyl transferase family 2 n=1 Tax=Berkelbacteria bacterium GW2011_GWA2_35_9 TaxID=1618333 RepID=A0A0G0GB80_9BACT|nr:MAG: hypothetical protein UR93_C0005G0033 [Berkelbacteria bacterium GW2011_GWA2_35_9]